MAKWVSAGVATADPLNIAPVPAPHSSQAVEFHLGIISLVGKEGGFILVANRLSGLPAGERLRISNSFPSRPAPITPIAGGGAGQGFEP